MPVLNLSKSKSEPLPQGRYVLEIVEATEEVSKAGEPYLKLQLAVPADREYANKRVFCSLTYQEGKAFMLVNFLKTIGYTDEELNEFEANEEFYTKIIGMEVGARLIVTQQDDYEPKNEVKKFFPPEDE